MHFWMCDVCPLVPTIFFRISGLFGQSENAGQALFGAWCCLYSKTCFQRPAHGAAKSDLIMQVVS